MEIKNIHEHAGWYASYMEDEQGRALVEALKSKVEGLEDLIERVVLELDDEDFPPSVRIASAIQMFQNKPEVDIQVGSFKWKG